MDEVKSQMQLLVHKNPKIGLFFFAFCEVMRISN